MKLTATPLCFQLKHRVFLVSYFVDRFSWSVVATSVRGRIHQDASTTTRDLSTRENGCPAKIAREYYKHESSHVVTLSHLIANTYRMNECIHFQTILSPKKIATI